MSREIRTEIAIRTSPERVWAVLTEFGSYREWNPFVREISGEARVGARLTVRLQEEGGRTMTFRPRVLVWGPGRELRWLGRLGIPGLFDGEHSFALAPAAGGVTFSQTEQFRGLLVPFLWKRLQRGTKPMFVRMNEALRARAETLLPPPP